MDISNIQKFYVDWKIQRAADGSATLRLLGGWHVACIWSKSSSPKSITMKHINGGAFYVGGYLTFLVNGAPVLRKKIAVEYMHPSVKILNINLRKDPPGSEFSLKGRLYITRDAAGLAYLSLTNLRNRYNSLSALSGDYLQLLNPETSPVATDVTLKCVDGSIPAHKFVLSTRSPVFAAMFAHSMSESQTNEVNITDISKSTMRTLVDYMYTGQPVELTISTAIPLLIAADKYGVVYLKKKVCDTLMKNISIENVLSLLYVGDAIAPDLKSRALDYLCNSSVFSALQNTEEWKSLQTKKPAFAIEILSSLVKSKDEKIMAK